MAPKLLLEGLGITSLVLAASLLGAAACAFGAGLARLSRDPVVRWTSRIYVELFRGTSALVQLFWFYFALPSLLGISLPAVAIGILVLSLNVGAYGAEVVRAAIEEVPRAQLEAATALGLSRRQRFRHVVLPQALRAMLPTFGNLSIELLKGTAIVGLIAVTDLTRAGLLLREEQPSRTLEILALLLVGYFVLASLLAAASRAVERRLSRGFVRSTGA